MKPSVWAVWVLSVVSLWAEPGIGVPVLTPTQIPRGTPAQIVVTTSIPDASLIPASVNLQRLGTAGTRVIGPLRDDGTQGDAVAGDRTFTAVATLTEPVAGTVSFRISAAFLGKVQRLFSPTFSLIVTDQPAVPVIVSGRVEFNTGGSVAGALIAAGLGPSSSVSTTTDRNGNFRFQVQTRTFPVRVNVQVHLSTIPAIDTARWVTAETNALNVGRIVVPNPQGSEISLMNGSGQSPDGTVRVSNLPAQVARFFARTFDPDATPEAFPGDFSENNRIPLNSSVFLWGEALNAQGQPISNLGQAVGVRARVPRSQWADLEDIDPGTDRIDLPIYVFNESLQIWQQESVGWLEDGLGTVLPEDAQPVILNGSFSGDIYATMVTNHLSWLNVDYPYLGPWTLSRLDTNRRNSDCLYNAANLARTIFRTACAQNAYAGVNKPNTNLNTEIPDGSASEFKSDPFPDNSEFGHTAPSDFKDLIHLNEKLWDRCDEKKPETTFLMAVTMLHETAHWKHDVKKYEGVYTPETDVPGGEAGLATEQLLFGNTIWTTDGKLPVTGVRRGDGTAVTQDQLSKLTDPEWWRTTGANCSAQFWQNFWGTPGTNRLISQAIGNAAVSPLQITLIMSQPLFEVGTPVLATVRFLNAGNAPIRILGLMRIPGYPLSLRVEDSNGAPVFFAGAKLKLGYAESDYITLAPGQTLDRSIDFTRDAATSQPLFRFTKTDTYMATVYYSPWFGLPETASNTAVFTIRGGATLVGTVVNASNSSPLAGATVRVLSGTIELASAVTSAAGFYSITALPAGTYTVEVSAPGFLRTTRANVALSSRVITTLNLAVTPLLARGEMRIVLTWNANPSDLDTHLWLPSSRPYHIFYGERGEQNACPYAALDVDDRDGFGPETLTISQRFVGGDYIYAINQFAGAGDISSSGARVQVFDSSGLIATFTPPVQGTGAWWNVMRISGATGAITEVNTIGASPGPYPDTASGCSSQANTGVRPEDSQRLRSR